MKRVAILGAGFAGLAAAYHLTKKGYQVTVLEKDDKPGGLAVGFKEKNWQWSLEKHYHHFFTNDFELINIAAEIGLSSSLIFPKSLTSLYYQGKIYPFNTPLQILNFSPLNFINRLRLGLVTAFLKILPEPFGIKLEKYTAFDLANKLFGKEVFKIIWEPLFSKKFGPPSASWRNGYASQVNFSWLWARIKKRTLQLGYVEGGFQTLADKLAQKVEEQGGKIVFNTEIKEIKQSERGWKIRISRRVANGGRQDPSITEFFDVVISTLPSPIFTKLVANLPQNYVKQLSSIPHLHALNLILETKKPFLNNTYWLNINDTKFPFLCVVQHTNFIDTGYYGGHNILYISNYLPFDHPYFKKSARELLKIYEPYLKKINPEFRFQVSGFRCQVFVGAYAQPVFLTNYSKIRPFGEVLPNLYFRRKKRAKGVYFANLDSVYPWDRGTNYALEMGRKVAELVNSKSKIQNPK